MNLGPQGSILTTWYKKVLKEWNQRPQGSIFTTWYKRSHHNWTYELKGLFFPTWSNRQHIRYSYSNNQRLATPVQMVWVSALTRKNDVTDIYLRQSTFSSLVYTKKNIQYTCTEDGFTFNPNDFMPESNNFTSNSNNPFCHPGLGLINLISCHEIKPESQLPWYWKAKRGHLKRKGVIDLVN